MCITRRGSCDTAVQIIMHLQYTPTRYQLTGPLAQLLHLQRPQTYPDIIHCLWMYIKLHRLQGWSQHLQGCQRRMLQPLRWRLRRLQGRALRQLHRQQVLLWVLRCWRVEAVQQRQDKQRATQSGRRGGH